MTGKSGFQKFYVFFDIDSSFEKKPGEKTKTGCNELETNHDELLMKTKKMEVAHQDNAFFLSLHHFFTTDSQAKRNWRGSQLFN